MTAAGALCGGEITQIVGEMGTTGADRYRPLAIIYAVIGGLLAVAFTRLSPAAEVLPAEVRLHAPGETSCFNMGIRPLAFGRFKTRRPLRH